MHQLVCRYIAYLRGRNSSPHTVDAYRRDLERFLATLPERIDPRAVTREHVRAFLARLYESGAGPATLARKLAAVRALYRFALLGHDPTVGVGSPKIPQKIPIVPGREEMEKFLDGAAEMATPRDRAILELLYGSGLRVSELVALDREDIDVTDSLVHVRHGKGDKERWVPVGGRAIAAVCAYVDREGPPSGALLLNPNGGRLSARSVRERLNHYARKMSVRGRMYPHLMRHAFATHLLRSGADLRSIQEMLGHAKLSTTVRYTHLADNDIRAAFEKAHPRA